MLTKQQQSATRNLQVTQSAWLEAYGWQALNARKTEWKHPKLKAVTYSSHDAMMATRADKTLGWP